MLVITSKEVIGPLSHNLGVNKHIYITNSTEFTNLTFCLLDGKYAYFPLIYSNA